MGRVLCVDDEPNILRSLQWLLQKQFEVKTATSGLDGLALVRKNDFDVVISDQRMPGMIGSEFLREVRKISPRTMRILLTGYSDLQAILRSVNEGEVFRFVNKPWNIAELPRVVAQAADLSKSGVAAEPEAIEPGTALSSALLLVDDDPAMAQVVGEALSPGVRLLHARNLAEAVEALTDPQIGVVVSDTRVGNLDSTRLLKLLKQQHPEIVSVVLSAQSDADMVIKLINQGQIYRFIPKPVKPGFVKLVLGSALVKHQQLRADPSVAKRHAVERMAAGSEENLVKDVQQVARTSTGGLLDKIAGGLRRLFGR